MPVSKNRRTGGRYKGREIPNRRYKAPRGKRGWSWHYPYEKYLHKLNEVKHYKTPTLSQHRSNRIGFNYHQK